MILQLTSSELGDLNTLYQDYLRENVLHIGELQEYTDLTVTISEACENMLEEWAHGVNSAAHPLDITAAQWRTLVTIINHRLQNITQQAPNSTFALLHYPALQKKIMSYELAIHVEEADTAPLTLTVHLAVSEARGIDHAYREHIAIVGYDALHQSEKEYLDTLTFLTDARVNIHAAAVQQNRNIWKDTPQPVLITVQQWKAFREAIIAQIAVCETFQSHGILATQWHRGILAKFDALTLAARIVEAEENDATLKVASHG